MTTKTVKEQMIEVLEAMLILLREAFMKHLPKKEFDQLQISIEQVESMINKLKE